MKLSQLKTFIHEAVEDVLDEVASTPGNPNVFWLVTTVSPNVPDKVQDLANGELEGVTGISDNNRIMMHWMGIGRNAVLIMNARYVMQDNKDLNRVIYDDPRELTKNNLALLRRIFNAREGGDGGRHVLQNLLDRLYRNALTSNDDTTRLLGTSLRDGYIPTFEVVKPYANEELKINSPKELAAYFKVNVAVALASPSGMSSGRAREELDAIPEWYWLNMVNQAIIDSVRTYSSEGEWVISSPTLRIPQKSKLLIAVHTLPKDYPEAAQAKFLKGEEPKLGVDIPTEVWTRNMSMSTDIIKTVYEYGLDKIYKVRFIDMEKFKSIQIKMQVKHKYG